MSDPVDGVSKKKKKSKVVEESPEPIAESVQPDSQHQVDDSATKATEVDNKAPVSTEKKKKKKRDSTPTEEEREKVAAAEEPAHQPSSEVSAEPAPKTSKKSKKSESNIVSEHEEHIDTAPSKSETQAAPVASSSTEASSKTVDGEKKAKKRSHGKEDKSHTDSVPHDSKTTANQDVKAGESKSQPPAPKRRKSVIFRLIDKIRGKGSEEAPESKDNSDKKEHETPAQEHEQAPEEPVVEEVPRTKKKKSKKTAEEKIEEDAQADNQDIVEGEYEGEYQEEGEVQVEDRPALPPPRIPPPSAPKKAPAGPVKQELAVTSVFSMKPQIKIEVDDVEEAKEYDVEEVKPAVDFSAFCQAKPKYTIGKEESETAYNRNFSASCSEEPKDVLIKFYSKDPPRLLSEADISAHIELLRQLEKETKNILPLLDEFTVPVQEVEPMKDSATDNKSEEPETKNDEPQATAAENGASKDNDVVEVQEGESKKKKKKQKKTETPANPHPEPPIALPKPESTSKPQKSPEHDRILVFEKLPDVLEWISSNSEVYSERHAASIIKGVLLALKSVHGLGYMHRAVSPHNILIRPDGESVLTGFDNASKLDSKSANVMSPEKFKAPEISHSPSHDQAVDLWGIGVVSFYILSGTPPFHETNNTRLRLAIRDVKFEFKEAAWAPVSKEGLEFCKALILKDPSQRLTVDQALEHDWIKNNGSDAKLSEAASLIKG